MMEYRKVQQIERIGLCDADLLDNGSRHPNLVLMKIAGFLSDNNILFELILDQKADISRYDHIFLSRVFTFTKLPEFYRKAKGTPDEAKFHIEELASMPTRHPLENIAKKEKRTSSVLRIMNT